jgi:hypothetical protein
MRLDAIDPAARRSPDAFRSTYLHLSCIHPLGPQETTNPDGECDRPRDHTKVSAAPGQELSAHPFGYRGCRVGHAEPGPEVVARCTYAFGLRRGAHGGFAQCLTGASDGGRAHWRAVNGLPPFLHRRRPSAFTLRTAASSRGNSSCPSRRTNRRPRPRASLRRVVCPQPSRPVMRRVEFRSPTASPQTSGGRTTRRFEAAASRFDPRAARPRAARRIRHLTGPPCSNFLAVGTGTTTAALARLSAVRTRRPRRPILRRAARPGRDGVSWSEDSERAAV